MPSSMVNCQAFTVRQRLRASSRWTVATISVDKCSLAVSLATPIRARLFSRRVDALPRHFHDGLQRGHRYPSRREALFCGECLNLLVMSSATEIVASRTRTAVDALLASVDFPGGLVNAAKLPAEKSCAPGQSGPKAAHQHKIASLNASFAIRLIQSQRNRRR